MFDAARRAQAEIQHYLTAEGESEFVSVGKAGPVELMARPPPVGEKFQVVGGRLEEVCTYEIIKAVVLVSVLFGVSVT